MVARSVASIGDLMIQIQPTIDSLHGQPRVRWKMQRNTPMSIPEMRGTFCPFCEKYGIRRLEVFGSTARGTADPRSDVNLLVTLDNASDVATGDLLEMAGGAEELVGTRVGFVLRNQLETSGNSFAKQHILSSAVCVYGG
jgi:predicted nucleotidyltransferase